MEPIVHRFSDPASLALGIARDLVGRIVRAAVDSGTCRLALSGGSTPRPLFSKLAEPGMASQVDWANVEVFWADERLVPPDHEASNYRVAREILLDRVPIPDENVHRVCGELAASEAVNRYARALGDEPLDVVLLGMGADGHTASLFPETPDLPGQPGRVVATTSPEPPHERVSLTLRALDSARTVMLLVAGDEKAPRLAEAYRQLTGPAPSLPIAWVRPASGDLHWYVDEAAAAGLPRSGEGP